MTKPLLLFLICVHAFSQAPANHAGLKGNAYQNPLTVLWIDLSGKNLQVLPDSILKFKNLRAIYLSKNPNLDLHQAFELLKNLENFENVDLQDCNIQSLPANIFELAGLNKINLSKNPIRSLPKQFTKFTKLEQLELSELLHFDWKPAFDILSKMPALKVVAMNRMNLKTMPANFKKLQQVGVFYLNENLFEAEEKIRIENSVPHAQVKFNGM